MDNECDAEEYNIWLLPILNSEPPKGHASLACCQRVRRLLSDLQQLDANRRALRPLARDRCEGTPYGFGFVHRFRDPKAEGIYRTSAVLVETINSQLWRYRWAPEVLFGLDEPIKSYPTWDERSESYYHENLSARVFLDELSEGRIDRFRQCVHCARWFYAITNHQKYCRPKCRVGEHSQGEGFKKKRARYMREKYRPAIRERDAIASRVASPREEKSGRMA
jgi:hypothetical protein